MTGVIAAEATPVEVICPLLPPSCRRAMSPTSLTSRAAIRDRGLQDTRTTSAASRRLHPIDCHASASRGDWISSSRYARPPGLYMSIPPPGPGATAAEETTGSPMPAGIGLWLHQVHQVFPALEQSRERHLEEAKGPKEAAMLPDTRPVQSNCQISCRPPTHGRLMGLCAAP